MSLPAWVRAAAVGAGALSMLLPGAMAAAAAPGDLIDSTPAVVVLEVPAPGESVDWSMSVTNLTDGSLPLSLEILGAGEEPLFAGEHGLRLSVAESGGRILVHSTSVADLLDEPMTLSALAAGSTYELRGSVSLPREADNRYQGMSGTLTLRFATSASEPTPDPTLPVTGADAIVAMVALGAALALAGALIVIAVRSRTKESQS